MSAVDQSGLPPERLDAVRAALDRDPGLAEELEMILPAVDPARREAFWRAFADLADCRRPAAGAVLEALVATATAGRVDDSVRS